MTEAPMGGSEPPMIQANQLTKRYGTKLAVDQLSFQARPGRVTGFLGPNGAGKSTTMRLILGLDAPSGGSATVNGRQTARDHLLCLAHSNGIPRRRVQEVLELAGLTQVANRRVRGFSLGMGQRLGIASALLGDPGILILDEPVNGLDTDGIRWIRDLLRDLAREGRTVFVSSHLMSELELTADHLIVIGRGRLLADTPMREFIERNSQAATLVRSPQWERLRRLLEGRGARVQPGPQGSWGVSGLDAATIGAIAATHQIQLHELAPRSSSLEEAYLRMTDRTVDHRASRQLDPHLTTTTGEEG